MGILAGIGALASGVADVLGAGKSLSHSGASGISSAKAFFYNELSARREYQRNLQMLRESPFAQLEGLSAAGLNPILYMSNPAYPSVSSGSGVSASPASTPAVDHLGRGIMSAVKGMQEAKLFEEDLKSKEIANNNAPAYNKAQINLLDKQAKAAEKQAALSEAEAEATRLGGGRSGSGGGFTIGHGKKGWFFNVNPLYLYRQGKATLGEFGSDFVSGARRSYDFVRDNVQRPIFDFGRQVLGNAKAWYNAKQSADRYFDLLQKSRGIDVDKNRKPRYIPARKYYRDIFEQSYNR